MRKLFQENANITRWFGHAKELAKKTAKLVVLTAFLVCAPSICAYATPSSTPSMTNCAVQDVTIAPNTSTIELSARYKEQSERAKGEKAYWLAELEKDKKSKAAKSHQVLEKRTQKEWVALYNANSEKLEAAKVKPHQRQEAAKPYKTVDVSNNVSNNDLDKIIAKQLYKTAFEEVSRNKYRGCSDFTRVITLAAMKEINKQAGTIVYNTDNMAELLSGAAAFQLDKITGKTGRCLTKDDILAGKLQRGDLVFFKRRNVVKRVKNYPKNISHTEIVIVLPGKNEAKEIWLARSDAESGASLVPFEQWRHNIINNKNGRWAVDQLYVVNLFDLANADKMAQLKSDAKTAGAQMSAKNLPTTASPSSAAQTSTADSVYSLALKNIATDSRNNRLNELSSAKKPGSVRVAYNPPVTFY